MEVRSDRTYRFDADVSEVWDAFGRVEDYRRWWPWLSRLDAEGLVSGDRWDCTVRPPVPYLLRFVISLDDVEPLRHITATVSGDIVGHAHLALDDSHDGCEVRLASSLAPRSATLRAVTTLTPWLARFGHDWVLDTGLRQFRDRAL